MLDRSDRPSLGFRDGPVSNGMGRERGDVFDHVQSSATNKASAGWW